MKTVVGEERFGVGSRRLDLAAAVVYNPVVEKGDSHYGRRTPSGVSPDFTVGGGWK
jgi:hypothetical protein